MILAIDCTLTLDSGQESHDEKYHRKKYSAQTRIIKVTMALTVCSKREQQSGSVRGPR